MSPKLTAYFNDYQAYHRSSGNKVCHFLGIPFIAISLLGLLATFPLGPANIAGSPLFRLDGGSLLWIVAVAWYLTLDWKVGTSFSTVALGAYFLGRAIPVPALWGLFVVGWILQLIGHWVYEKKSPAFSKNVLHILIGPIWIFADIMGLI